MSKNISIKQITLMKDMKAVERLQQEIWGLQDHEIIRARLMSDMQDYGGLILGAINEENQSLIGFLLGFVGYENGEIKHYSAMMGVLPEYRSSNIGYRLKLYQRHFVLQQGINLISWTFDPLESINAYLNLNKLGCKAKVYERNMYGHLLDNRNFGLPSDRLFVEWRIESQRVIQRLEPDSNLVRHNQLAQIERDARKINHTYTRKGIKVIKDFDLDLEDQTVILEIPSNIQKIKKVDLDIALDWRLATRAIFECYFSRSYEVIEFISRIQEKTGDRESFYILKNACVT
jgi:predicted GNAT superfamily acetyltransferase